MTRKVIVGMCAFIFCHELLAQKLEFIPQASQPPLIDGAYEPVWDLMPYVEVQQYLSGAWEDSLDFSGRWKAVYDQENIYFLFQVTDNQLFNLGSGAAKYWIHDCAEIFIDLMNDKDEEVTDTPGDDNYQYRFIWNLDNEPIYENPPVAALENASATVLSGTDEVGYYLEIKIPWNTLIGTFDFGEITVGKMIGAEFKLSDLDQAEEPEGWAPDAEILWSNDTQNGLKLTSNFGTLVLTNHIYGDTEPPRAIHDLTGEPTGSKSILMQWTSTGDDGDEGLAVAYNIRYAADEQTLLEWEEATTVEAGISPAVAGTQQSLQVHNLPAGESLFVGVRSVDNSGNVSDLSNILNIKLFDPDNIPPGQIENLAFTDISPFSFTLHWIASGDDDREGLLKNYDIRYALTSIDDNNWEQATPVADEPKPAAPGTEESMEIHGLTPGTTYFFAIRGLDEEPNASAISENLEVTTLPFDYPPSSYTFDEFLGINSFLDDPVELQQAVGFVREYHNWNWDEGDIWSGGGDHNYPGYPNNKIKFSPSYAGGGTFDFDAYYTAAAGAGLDVVPCIQGSVSWLYGATDNNHHNKPVSPEGADSEDPFSYKEHAHYLFQFTARYGSATVADNLLTLAEDQERHTGMSLIRYIENWNEPDNDWSGSRAYFSPEEMAAMTSADYDGHEGRMGTTFGVKNADPEMKLVMGGLVYPEIDYLDRMRRWFVANRDDQKFAADVINVHHYAWNGDGPALGPEEDNFKERMQAVVRFRDEYVPDAEVWISEFGWDTHKGSPLRPKTAGNVNLYDAQANLLVRSYLEFAAARVDRAAMFMLRDVDVNSAQQFSTSGLTTEKLHWQKKPSWFYLFSLKNILKGQKFIREVTSFNEYVNIYEFGSEDADNNTFVVWSPTTEGKIIENYKLTVPAHAGDSVLFIELMDGDTTGIQSYLPVTRNSVQLNVSERPVFIRISTGERVVSALDSRTFDQFISADPNPADQFVQIKNNSPEPIKRIEVINLAGQKILDENGAGNAQELNVSNFLPGVYIVRIRTDYHVVTKKIIKH